MKNIFFKIFKLIPYLIVENFNLRYDSLRF